MIHCGCKTIKLEDFEKEVIETHKDSEFAKWYLAHIPVLKMIADSSEEAFRAAKKKNKEAVEQNG